ncbi:MAG: hypothetical protein HXS41_08830 [Theionarchaea archaeon]|nr:hypothetical protein [Theionarchaea archaeon]MBU7001564.1 hypothetical protein [Theionarchaea archaeon]MBU7021150.1 hypothetical protein [Theionarchaea archaeon]MBU7033877.1 hypothetical protein [Theionarchaea archaeon]MBU7040591.1 hypothetical protein [Theionarchaea archaeon]
MITEHIREHGIPIYVEREFHIKPYRDRSDVCYYGDIVAVYQNGRRWYIVGIEVKDWKARVGSKLAAQYLSVYGEVCEYFYIAARRFSQSLLRTSRIGLFSLESMKVIRRSQYLFPDERLRISAVKRMKKGGLNPRVLESPYQTMLDAFL